MQKTLIRHIEKKLNIEILVISQLYGGCINQSYKIETKDQSYFIKINNDIDLFTLEVKGLNTLRSTNTFHIPEVILYSKFKQTYYLIMELSPMKKTEKKTVFLECHTN